MARAEKEAPKLEADPGLRELASNPLYLTLMALLLEEGQEPHRNRTRLYDQVFELLLEGRHRPAGEPMEHQDAVRRVLRHLACEMTIANRDSEPLTALEARLYRPAADALREPLERVPRWRRSMRPFLDDLARRTGILGPHDGPDADWRFWHRTFREALTAEKLEEELRAAGQEAVLEKAREISGDESRWAEPFALLAGRVENPDELIRARSTKTGLSASGPWPPPRGSATGPCARSCRRRRPGRDLDQEPGLPRPPARRPEIFELRSLIIESVSRSGSSANGLPDLASPQETPGRSRRLSPKSGTFRGPFAC